MMFRSKKAQYAPGQPRQQPYRQPAQQQQPYPGPQYPQQVRPLPGAFGTQPKQPTVSISPKTLIIIGAIALVIILTFTIILVIRANMPKCPEMCKPGLCDSDASCSKETNYECVKTPKPGCDLQLEMKKARCKGKEGSLVKAFDPVTEECFTDEDPAMKVDVFSSTQRKSGGGVKFRITTEMDQPFNLGNDEVIIEVVGEQIPDTVQDLTITKVELDANDANRQTVILGETFVNSPLPSPKVAARIPLQLDVPGDATSGVMGRAKLIVSYTYNQVSGSKLTERTGTLSLTFTTLKLSWIRPSIKYGCPTGTGACDDGDPATRDYCDVSSAPFCKHEALAGVCGNGICEVGENSCTCAQDCGQCSGAGKVTVSQCVMNQCQVQLRPDVVVQPVSIVKENSLGKIVVTTNVDYNSPFDADNDRVNVRIKLEERDEAVDRFSIDRIQLLKGSNIEISSLDVNENINVPGQSVERSLVMPSQQAEEDITPKLVVQYTIVTLGKADRKSYSQSLQRVTVFAQR